MARFLIKLSISPVQEFIVQAGRTRDLCSASSMLVNAIYAARLEFMKHSGDILYPANDNQHHPNYFVGILNLLQEQLSTIVHQVEEAARRSWKTSLSSAFQYRDGDDFWFDDLFTIRWVAQQLSENDSLRQEDIQNLDRLFEARKRTREFSSIPGHLAGEKCTQCGLRPVADLNWQHLFKSDVRFRKRERLCSVCTGKRMLKLGNSIKTAAELASFHFREEIKTASDDEKSSIEKHWKEFKKTIERELAVVNLPDSWLDLEKKHCSLFYESGLEDIISPLLTTDGKIVESKKQSYNALLMAQKGFLKAFPCSPSKYYCLVIFDGDHIGKWIGGDGYADKNNSYVDYCKTFSQSLSIIAKAFDTIITENGGQLVYAGGDDLFALLPAEHVFSAVSKLKKTFAEKLEFCSNAKNQSPTISGALVFLPIHQPLRLAVSVAYESANHAKKTFKRNALVTTVLQSSGGSSTFGHSWNTTNSHEWTDICKKILSAISGSSPMLSSRFLYRLSELALICSNKGRLEPEMFSAVLSVLIQRQCLDSNAEEEAKQAIHDGLVQLAKYHPPGDRTALDNVLHALHGLAVIAREAGDR